MIIKFNLNDIDSAIKQLDDYINNLPKKIDDLIETLIKSGVEIARRNLVSYNAIESQELFDCLTPIMYVEEHRGLVFVDCNHGAFVEFGTGIVGKRNQKHPSQIPWEHDIQGHGDSGWFYYDESGRRWTKGMPSRPFLWDTSQELRNQLIETARGVFAENDRC